MLELPSSSSFVAAILTVALSLGMAACHENAPPYDPKKAVAIDTAVNPTAVGVGERAQVFCVRLNGKGEPLEGGAFTIGVAPTEQVFVEGYQVFSQRSGAHQVSCNDPELGLTDPTPAELVVNAGPAVRTALSLNPPTVAAGQTSAVTCVAQDQYGNPAAANLRLEVTPADSVTIDGTTGVSATEVGTYEVLCYAATVDEANRQKGTLTVVAGPPAGMRLRFAPEQLAYRISQQVTVTGEAVDAHGNPIAGEIPIAGLDATPAGHHRVSGTDDEKIRFDLEGVYTVSAHSKADPNLTASAPLVVDQTRPVLTLTSPERGLVTDILESVKLAGTVSDNLGRIAELRVGDLAIPVATEGGAFSIDVPLAYGINLLDVHALDPYGNEAIATRAVEKSSDYYAMAAQAFEQDGVANGAALMILPEVFDDGDHTEAVRDDLAHLMEFIIENIDFASLLPNPLTTFSCISGQCRLEFTSVTMDDVKVTLTLVPGRIHFRAELVRLAGTITLWFPCDTPVICQQRPEQPLPGTVSTNRVTLDSDIFLAIVGGETVARTENTVVEIENLAVSIQDPTGLAQAAIDLVITFLQEPLVAALEQLVVDAIENELAKALDGLFSALNVNQEFDLPSPIPGQPANTLVIKTQPKGVDIAPERLQLRVDGLAYAKFPMRPHEHLGSIGHRGCAPPTALAFPSPAPIVVGLHDDMINQLLFAIWEGGTLSLVLGPEEAASLVGSFGLQDAHITVDALLPPVYNSCRADGVNVKERVQLGDLWIEAEASFAGEPIHLGLWILTEAPITVDFAPNDEGALQARLALGELEPMWIEVVINEGRFADNDEAVIGLVQSQLIPQLLSTVSDSATFTLPSIDLGAMTPAVPAGTVINLDVRGVARDNQYLTVQGAFE